MPTLVLKFWDPYFGQRRLSYSFTQFWEVKSEFEVNFSGRTWKVCPNFKFKYEFCCYDSKPFKRYLNQLNFDFKISIKLIQKLMFFSSKFRQFLKIKLREGKTSTYICLKIGPPRPSATCWLQVSNYHFSINTKIQWIPCIRHK